MSKKRREKEEFRQHLTRSRKELKKIKVLRAQAKIGVVGAADELEVIRQKRILRNAVVSPLEQIKMEPRFI